MFRFKLFGLNRKPQIKTEVIGPMGSKTKKYVVEGDHIIIRKARPGPGGQAHTAKFDKNCLIPYEVGGGPFKRLKQKLMLIEGADQCIGFHFTDNIAEVDLPVWDRETEEKLFKAGVIKAAGSISQKVQVPTALYVFMFIIMMLQIFGFLVSTGRIRFG